MISMTFLRPNKTKIKISGIFILVIFLFSICSSAGGFLLNRSATSKFEKAAKVELEKEAKPLIDKLNKQSFDGTRYSTIYLRVVYVNFALSILLAVLFSYLGSCIICTAFIKVRSS